MQSLPGVKPYPRGPLISLQIITNGWRREETFTYLTQIDDKWMAKRGLMQDLQTSQNSVLTTHWAKATGCKAQFTIPRPKFRTSLNTYVLKVCICIPLASSLIATCFWSGPRVARTTVAKDPLPRTPVCRHESYVSGLRIVKEVGIQADPSASAVRK